MEMESSRRPPFDRSNLLSKKPRLSEESATLSARQFQQPLQRSAINSGSGSGSSSTRFRDRESDDSGAARGSLQHQELVNQYKTALAELTFNSKPIITNLTIIAGENLQAAKAIAATICANIIEVPTEQKLPSLYLLDSIVKNIGRDYIKYFAVKLPEVFCKAYRHVDPSIHSGMRHLFGTWKGVFPPQPLQIIEKELGFSTSANGTASGTTTSKSDSQSQRQPHSIHVNPKYLEERQRLQQSSKMKGTDIGMTDGSSEDVEKPQRTAGAGTERPWMDPSIKMHNERPQREPLKESSLPKQGGAVYGDYEFASGLSRPSSTPGGKPSERVVGQRWLGAGREGEESVSGERNGYDIKRGIPKYAAVRSANSSIPSMQNQPRIGAEISGSWKNSEEEEFMWDDLGTKVTVPGTTAVIKKEVWSDDLEKVDLARHLSKWQSQTEVRSNFEREHSADSLSSEQKDQVPLGHPRSSHWKMHELHQVNSSSPLLQQVGAHSVIGPSSAGVSNFGFPTTAASASPGSVRRHPSPSQSVISHRPPSPALSKRDPRQNLIEKDNKKSPSLVRSDPRAASFSGQLNVGVRDKSPQDSIPSRHQNLNVQKLQAHTLQKPPPPTPSVQQRHAPASEQLSNSNTELSDIVQKAQQLLDSSSMKKGTSSGSLNPVSGNIQGQSNVSSLLAAVMNSGLLSGSPVSGQIGAQLPSTTIPPSQSTIIAKDAATSSGPRNSTATISRSKVEKPALVPPVLSSPMSSTLAQSSNVAAPKSNPLSILSTLISKGLISAPNNEAAGVLSVKSEAHLQAQSPVATVASGKAPLVSRVSTALPESFTEKLSSSEPDGKKSDTIKSTEEEIDLIGFEFRPRLLRDLHPVVIDRLSENLPHRCTDCGLRFKLEERLVRHSEWHAFKNSIPNCLNKPSRRWYSKPADWISGKAGFPFGYNSTRLMEGSSRVKEEGEKMVPADESQCVCLLCGELFEDFYKQERDEWMFKGAVYLSTSSGSSEEGLSCSESGLQNLIVHANCMSGDLGRDLGSIRGIKVEKDT